ncbi:multidrug ABC transporter ATPase [Gluconobacter oxydans]|nr:ABC transporter ATP-binding protein [Gluconobacter oxydans]KXV15262.1 multidrug ABC transporter ATPase [Gluconobacter oxydans]MCP1248574.1 ABC transporter ATP-binding protein/permease [Gluconobacter oxydans]WKE47542.1 ABC transporter ATP-binding protein/permease [Gluconobacter oxydans]
MSDTTPLMTRQQKEGRKQDVSFTEVLSFVSSRWRHHPLLLSKTLGGVGLATLADVCTPILAGRLVDDISRHVAGPAVQQTAELLHLRDDAFLMVAGLIVLGLVGLFGRRSSFIGISHLTLAIMHRIANQAFDRVQRFSTDWHANNFAGSTVRKLTRGIWAIDTLDDTLLLLIAPEVLVLGGTTAVLMFRSPLMGSVLALSVVLFACLSITLTLRYVAPTARASNEWDTKMGAAMADAVTCNPVVKAFGAEDREDARLDSIIHGWRQRTLRTWIRGTNSANLQALASLAMRMLLIGLAVWLWWDGKAGPGDVAYVLTMMFLVQGYLRDLGQQVSQVQRSVNEMEELVAIFRRDPAIQDAPDAQKAHFSHGAIRFEHVDFQYPGQAKPLYHDLSIDIAPGSRVALVGPSGSGKTTLTKLLQRLYDVNGGRIVVDGQDIAHVTQDSLRSHIAIVPQEPILFHRTLAENIAYARPDASRAEIEEAARFANAAPFIERLPEGYETMVGERGVKLSGGERQRVAIARAFLADAPILIFDEATSSLDSESESLVQDAMRRLMQNRTVIVVAHRLSTVMELDRILVFSQGELKEDGTHAALIEREGGIYRRLFELQSLEA